MKKKEERLELVLKKERIKGNGYAPKIEAESVASHLKTVHLPSSSSTSTTSAISATHRRSSCRCSSASSSSKHIKLAYERFLNGSVNAIIILHLATNKLKVTEYSTLNIALAHIRNKKTHGSDGFIACIKCCGWGTLIIDWINCVGPAAPPSLP